MSLFYTCIGYGIDAVLYMHKLKRQKETSKLYCKHVFNACIYVVFNFSYLGPVGSLPAIIELLVTFSRTIEQRNLCTVINQNAISYRSANSF